MTSSQQESLPVAASPAPLPPSTNGNENTLSQSMKRLSLTAASATALPPSPQVSSPQRKSPQRNYPSSPNGNAPPPRSPLHRSPSSQSLDARSSTPTLHRKASMNSIQGVGGVTPPRRTSSTRRISGALGTSGQVFGKSPLSGNEEGPAPLTAASVASTHFKTEIDLHNEDPDVRSADTIVILHDSCYGHRYSRPRTSRAGLNTIVERPERIHASILGVSVAYIRLGDRHSEGLYPIHPKKNASSIPTIPFRIRKTTRKLTLSSPTVTNVHGVKWMEELKMMCDGAEAKLAMNGKELTRPEMNRGSDQETPAKLHEGDLYLCSESLNAMEGALGAVCEGVDAVFNGTASGKGPHRAFVTIRPPGHHCSGSYPSGFCWLNNVHVGISHAALAHGLTHAAIIDFDLHHGDGSQAIAWEHNSRSQGLNKNAAPWKKTSIGYFSLHDINSYPCEMGDEEKVKNASLCIENAHGQYIWNVHLQPWKSEHEFWELYESRYSVLLDKARAFLRTQTDRIKCLPGNTKPKGAIFLSAGFDASEWESSGMQRHKVNVPTEFYARFTRDVVKLAAAEGCSVNGRIISVLEGGYSDRALTSGVLSHLSGLAGGDPVAIQRDATKPSLGYEMASKMEAINHSGQDRESQTIPSYNTDWWTLTQLELLDAVVHPPAPPPEPKKPRDATPPTYFSPTASSTAKIITGSKLHRSASNISSDGNSPRAPSRPPTPPPPEVKWTVAAHELSKLLIPTDRQTLSCTPEDLSAEATRARRDRQSVLTPPSSTLTTPTATPSTRMALRERKATKPLSTMEEEHIPSRPESKAGRRKTVAGTSVLVGEKAGTRGVTPKPEPGYTRPTTQSVRRSSVSSTTGSATSEVPSTLVSDGNSRASSQAPSRRPGSSQSIRPESSMSSRTRSVPPITVKKTRNVTPAASRGQRRKTPVPDVPPSADIVADLPPMPRIPSAYTQIANGAVSTDTSKSGSSDVENVTSGVKKMKINLVTKPKNEMRGMAKMYPSMNGVNVSPDPEHLMAAASAPSGPVSETILPSIEQSSPPKTPKTPKASVSSRIAQLKEASNVPLPASSPPSQTQPSTPIPSRPKSSHNDVFIPYQPEGPTPNAAPRHEPLKWLEPNTTTPAPSPMKRGDLPVFTANSAIPFGPAPGAAKNEHKDDPSIWDVPETPKK